MGKEDFIKDALFKPNDYIAYHVGRELAELHPDKVIIEGDTGFFDLEAFVRAEKCFIVGESSLFSHIRTEWKGPGKKLTEELENSWLNVLWRGQLFDVVLITFSEDCFRSRHHWIVAESREFAEAFFSEVCTWSSEVRGEILIFQDGAWVKNKELYDTIKTATFDNLVLAEQLKQQLQNDFARFFEARETYERYSISWRRGALFIGPPGNGKTHTVKALINQLAKPCLYVKGFKSEYATDQENMGRVFARARITSPCFLVLEDLDAMIDDDNRAFFLNELDGFESNTGMVVLATTNHADRLDPALLNRPSRFDRKYHFNLPRVAERIDYIRRWNTQLKPELRLSEATVHDVAQITDDFSFAYLKELFVSATMRWMSESQSENELINENNAPPEMGKMDRVVMDLAMQLREQMNNATASQADSNSKVRKLGGMLERVWKRVRSLRG